MMNTKLERINPIKAVVSRSGDLDKDPAGYFSFTDIIQFQMSNNQSSIEFVEE